MYEIGTWGSLEALLGIALAFRNSVVGKVGATPHPRPSRTSGDPIRGVRRPG